MGADTAQVFHFGDFTLDQSRYQLQRDDRILRLERRPMELLFLLVERHGELVTREEVADRLWGTNVFVDIDQSINTAVRKVRQALRDDPEKPHFIETVVGKGYRFAAPVTCNGGIPGSMCLAEQPLDRPSVQSSTIAATASVSRAVTWKPKSALIALLALAIAAGAWWLDRSPVHPGAMRPPIRSVAVLPLKNLSGDPSQEYLADGMTEEIISRLSNIQSLRIISRTSVMRFKDTQLSAPEISKMLGADALMEGSVIREGQRIRVHAQLIRGASDEHFWSESYDREVRDALTLESEVAQAIAARVEASITATEEQRLYKQRAVAPEVYEFYLKGVYALYHSHDDADLDRATAYFEEAIAKDSTFAPAYVGLAKGHSLRGSIILGGAPPERERAKAVIELQKALQLDAELAGAHLALGDIYQEQWHWSEAEAEYRRALALNPNDAKAHADLATWLLCEGHTEEALDWARRARELDPLAVSGDLLGWSLYIARRYNDAIREERSALLTSPDDVYVLWSLGFVLIGNNQPSNAIPVLEKALPVSKRSPGVIGILARAYALTGQRSKALKLLAELQHRRQTHYVPAAAFVNAYLGLGETDQVFVWLEQACKEKSNLMQWLAVDPMFDPVRSDPRFADLLHRVGLG
ncbi:MAG TPA: winged helix-turn-helix domain-containing protein [Terriglobales bacterium]|nr:winged helix-turn-helix domain-containing protein [Terriglobales bacterium]